MLKIYSLLRHILKEIQGHHLSAFSAQATLFIILSAFPFLIILLNLFRFLPLSDYDLIDNLSLFIPQNIIPAVKSVILEISEATTSVYFISANIIAVIWSSGRGFVAIRHALNEINGTEETRNFIAVRIISSLYTLSLIFFLLLLLTFLIFSRQLSAVTTSPVLSLLLESLIYSRAVISFFVLFLFFTLLYRAIPNCTFPLRFHMPGALFSSAGWLLFSFFFFLYMTYFSNLSRIYGSLTIVIAFILWLYFCMYILFLGAELNHYLYSRRNRKTNKSCQTNMNSNLKY